ncbi:MAG: DNA polymerase, partial [Thermoplasmata archaeon]
MPNSSEKIILKGMLFDADYIDAGGKAWVRLWIKTEDGGTVVVYDPNFEPYFYAIVDENYDINLIREQIEKINGIKRTEIVKRKDYGRERNVIRITANFPKNVPNLREQVKNVEGVLEVREADIPFAIRYIIDKGLHPMDGVECVVEPIERKLRYPEYIAHEVKYVPLDKEYPLRILAFDIEVLNPEISVDPEKDEIIMISYATGASENEVGIFISENNEKKLIEDFLELVAKYDPDIILTYNGNEFDWPYLKKRAEKYGITLKIGRDGSPLLIRPAGFIKEARAPGRALVDLYIIVERDLPEVKVKTLKNIAQYL